MKWKNCMGQRFESICLIFSSSSSSSSLFFWWYPCPSTWAGERREDCVGMKAENIMDNLFNIKQKIISRFFLWTYYCSFTCFVWVLFFLFAPKLGALMYLPLWKVMWFIILMTSNGHLLWGTLFSSLFVPFYQLAMSGEEKKRERANTLRVYLSSNSII